MKYISKKRILIITLLFLVGIFLLISYPADNRKNIPEKILNRLKPNPGSLIDSSTKYARYKQILDSLEQISANDKIRIMGFGEGVGTLHYGLTKITECDTCKKFILGNQSEEFGYKEKYFLELKGYTLNTHAYFYIDKDKYFIENRFEDLKEIKVRFKTELDVHNKAQSALLIPISKKTYTTLKVIMWVIIPLLIFLSWIIFVLPIKVLLRIALGDPFNSKNISNLKLSGITLITIMLLPILSSWLLPLFLGSRMPKEIYFPVWLYIHDIKGWLVGGLAMLILASAFKNGFELQQEQDLTV